MSNVYPINNKKSNEWLLICCRIEVIGIIVIIVISNVYYQLSNI